MDMRTYSAAGTRLSEEFSEVIRVLGEDKQASFGSGKSWPIRFSLAMLYYVMVTEQEYLPRLSSGSSSMLSASLEDHGSVDMAVFMYSHRLEVGVRAGS